MKRSLTQRILGGVCGGIAEAYDVNVWMVRAAFVLTFIPGVPLYMALWVLLPTEDPTRSRG
ncbi:MAG: PspC domain-containing protein [Anaerolineae bacterium]